MAPAGTPPIHAAVLATPPGPLSLLVDDDGVLVAGGFTANPAELHARLGPRRRTLDLRRCDDLGDVTKVMLAYLDGDLSAVDTLAVDQDGTLGQQRVWAALRETRPGATVSYTELAAASGSPSAVRAAGTACGRNLIAPVVPCHRVVRRDGNLGGYYYGVEYKHWLLDHERRHAS